MTTVRERHYTHHDILTDDGPYPEEIAAMLRADLTVTEQAGTHLTPPSTFVTGAWGDLYEVTTDEGVRVLVAWRGRRVDMARSVATAIYLPGEDAPWDVTTWKSAALPCVQQAAHIAGMAVDEALVMDALRGDAKDSMRAEEGA